MKKLNVENMIKLGAILMIFAVAVCVMLFFIYRGTSKIVAMSEAKEFHSVLKDVFPDADDFTQGEGVKSPDDSVTIVSAYKAEKAGKIVGAVLEVTNDGYEGPIRMMAGVSIDGLITGVKILQHSESPGLGANVDSKKYFVDEAGGITFYGQFTGKSVNDPFSVEDDVVAITGSTVTSVAVARAVKAAGVAAVAWLTR